MEAKILAWSGYTTNQLIHKFYKRFAAGMAMIGVLQYGRYSKIVNRNNAALPKLACIFLAARYFERFVEQWKNIRYSIPNKPQKNFDEISKPKIDGHNVEDIVAFLMTTKGLQIEKMKQAGFRVDAQWVKKFGNNCERVGICEKGPNNSRVLATDNYEYIMDMLLSSPDSDKMGVYNESGVDYKPQPQAA